MYNLIIYLYQIGVAVYSLFNDKVKKMWQGERDAFRVLREKVDPAERYVWFHAASLGEFEQGRPIMEEFRRRHPDFKILLTFFSPSGYEVRKNYEGADIICYLPLDTITNARRFLRTIRPEMAFFIKYEFWYNYLHILKHRNVPVYSVSSIFRHGQIFFRWYGKQYGLVLKCFTHFFVQNELSKQLLSQIGLTNVEITGDTRFDRVLEINKEAKRLDAVEHFCGENKRPTMVVGSSWEPDEDVYLPYFERHRDLQLIIAPHVVSEERICNLVRHLEKMGKKVVRYSQCAANDVATTTAESNADVMIIDCYGLLSSIYNYGDIAYVGGGFGVGIHNILEAAVWSMPVIFGPNNARFQEAQDLKQLGGGFEITDADSFAKLMDALIGEEEKLKSAGNTAGEYVRDRSGATEKILSKVENFHKNIKN